MGVVEPADVSSIRELDFAAEVHSGDPAELRLSGSADIVIADSLEAMVGELHEALEASNARAVVIDMRSLELMNAAAFNALVTWLGLVHEMPPERRYQFRFRSNPEIHWQRRSLETLSCFATDLITVET
jgi:hypothetical protein